MATCNANPVLLSCNITNVATPSSPLYSKTYRDASVIHLPYNISISENTLAIIPGPCSIESEEQIMATAEFVKKSGAAILRGGAFKPRTSPYAFQGMGIAGLQLLRKAGDYYRMPIITEVLDSEDITIVADYADILQVGARNCQNFSLLRKLGKIRKPV
ncbi:MAG TPA: 3-deoxy-7-phosphoheptulonate synthase, partial [Spirochaetota bacterium]|nr:3-deoxy-7-phosphoheptulonate synthase [Spirochaetota bacterium]